MRSHSLFPLLALPLLTTACLPAGAEVLTGLGGRVDTLEASNLPALGSVSAYIERNETLNPRYFDQLYILNGQASDLELVPDPQNPRGTRKVFHMKLTKTGTGKNLRTEVSPKYEYTASGERWYAASLYFPPDWTFGANTQAVVFQLHTTPIGGPVSPPMAIIANDHSLDLETHAYSGAGANATSSNTTTQRLPLTALTTGVWHCFVVHADWQNTHGNGHFKLWMDGKLVYQSDYLFNDYETQLGNYPKTGIYQPGVMGPAYRHLYADFISIGDSTGNGGAADEDTVTFKNLIAATPCSDVAP